MRNCEHEIKNHGRSSSIHRRFYGNHPKTKRNVYPLIYKKKQKLDNREHDNDDDDKIDAESSQELAGVKDDTDYKKDYIGENNDDNKANNERIVMGISYGYSEEFDRDTEVEEKNKRTVPNEEREDENVEEWEEDETITFDPDYDVTDDDQVYSVDYKGNCPTKCPARNVMVCARCQHNIHRTFLSVCHLRLFNCRHPDEKLELVSRRPCMQSTPFLTGLPPAKTKQSDPHDRDPVLRFLLCRKKGRLQRDPRCKF
ncbi:uncharacterized protein LOC120635636 [Pararge aegeria]|uniref:uncharacterized protein LOC120635636 n=1 Tax=Pararge aegeria TaxID=116150 RepID=UPI0019D09B99|nr:uncharacterized protein LOC120635636 [Pararge aegeria]